MYWKRRPPRALVYIKAMSEKDYRRQKKQRDDAINRRQRKNVAPRELGTAHSKVDVCLRREQQRQDCPTTKEQCPVVPYETCGLRPREIVMHICGHTKPLSQSCPPIFAFARKTQQWQWDGLHLAGVSFMPPILLGR